MRLFASLLVAASLLTAPAFAAGRGDVFSVSDVAVDVTSADSSKARDLGFTQAQAAAFERLVERLTLPADLQRVGAPAAAGTPLDQYVDGVDIQQEGRSGTRYLARMAVSFNAPAIRKLLTDKGLTVYETRTAPVLVAPVLAGGTPEQAAAWRMAWEQGGFAEELAPIAVAPATLTGPPDWAQAQQAAATAGASTALYVVARVEGQMLAVALTEVAAGAAPRDLGQFTTAWQTSGADHGAALFKALATAANDRVQNEWKQKLVAGAGQRARVAAIVTFATQAEWQQVKSALAQASQTLVSDIQIEALAKDGAALSFSHTGSDAQLAAELNRYGVQYVVGAGGATLRAGGYKGFMEDQPRLFDFTEKGEGAGAFIVADSNRQAIGLLEQWRAWPGGALALTGPAGSGKSHLARLWAAQSGALMFSGRFNAAAAREAFAAREGRLVIDNADRVRDDTAVMLLLDLARTEGGAVLLVGQNPPGEWVTDIPDLRSRFVALLAAPLGEPDEKLITELIRRLCRTRFIELKENVAKYAVQHMERSYVAAHALVAEIDNLMVEGGQPVPYDIAAEALRRLERREHAAT